MNIKENTEVEEKVDVQESDASATLKPKSKSAGGTKSEMLAQMMKHFAGMKKEDLSSFLTKTLAQVGKEDDTVPDTSGANKASVGMKAAGKPSPTSAMKEDVAELFSGQEDLSEEFVDSASTLFEAAVANRVTLEVARLEEESEQKLEEQVTEALDELHEQVSMYMDYVVEKFMEDNKIAIENNFRVEATESFIEGLKNLFSESYVEVPEEKVNLVDELQESLAALTERLDEVESENVRLNSAIQEAMIEATFEEVTEGLVDTQVEKLRSLSEGVEYDSVEEYASKLEIIKKQYFSEDSEKETNTGLITEEDSVGSNDLPEGEQVVIPAEMRNYFDAISKTVKKQ